MSKFDSKKVMPRYAFIAVIMTLVAISVLGKTLYIMTASAHTGRKWQTA